MKRETTGLPNPKAVTISGLKTAKYYLVLTPSMQAIITKEERTLLPLETEIEKYLHLAAMMSQGTADIQVSPYPYAVPFPL